MTRQLWHVTGSSSFLTTPICQQTVELLLQLRSTEWLFETGIGEREDPALAVQTAFRRLRSQPVRDAVRMILGPAPKIMAVL